MPKPIILSEEQIAAQLTELPGWVYVNSKISKEFKFADFMDSLNFIVQLAPFFEAHDHHPDIHISYSKVLFELQRFDVGGKVTDTDFLTARYIESAYQKVMFP